MKKVDLGAVLALAAVFSLGAHAADEARQSEVAQRGTQVMPFSLKATTHVFTKTKDGGVQQVVVKDATDAAQIRLVRQHLHDLQARFARGDPSGPSQIHGDDMPGLAALKAAKPGQISFAYREIDDGAEITYRTTDATLLAAIHAWFDAQISDHGVDAVQGHEQTHGHVPMN